MKKNRIITCVIIIAALFVLGFGIYAVSQKKSSEGREQIRIGVLRTADSIPIYVANQEKIFEKYGVQVELVEFGSASEQSKAMEAEAIDVMMTDMIVECLLKKGGTDVRTIRTALGAEVSEGKFIIAASPNSDIESVEDLEGASVAISENTMMEFLVDSYCDELGIERSKVEKVSIPSLSLRYETVMEGKDVECAILPEPLGDYAVMNGARSIIDDTTLNNNYSISVIVASKELTDDAELLGKFANAYDEAVRLLNDSPDNYEQLILEVANVPDDMQGDYKACKYPENKVPSEEEVKRIVAWMKEKELIQENYEYDEIVDNSFLQ